MSESKIYLLQTNSAKGEPNRIRRREISEMLGLCRGIIADGIVSPEEVEFLRIWIASHPQAAGSFPGSAIAARLHRIYADGVVTVEERNDLLALLQNATGQKTIEAVTAPTTLPLDNPPPQVVFGRLTFCFTGKFASGLRSWCENETVARDGVCLPSVSSKLRFLVIGSVGNESWAHSSFGTKIEKAVSLKRSGVALSIIAEEHWQKSLQAASAR
jgi:hypothetical protein